MAFILDLVTEVVVTAFLLLIDGSKVPLLSRFTHFLEYNPAGTSTVVTLEKKAWIVLNGTFQGEFEAKKWLRQLDSNQRPSG